MCVCVCVCVCVCKGKYKCGEFGIKLLDTTRAKRIQKEKRKVFKSNKL